MAPAPTEAARAETPGPGGVFILSALLVAALVLGGALAPEAMGRPSAPSRAGSWTGSAGSTCCRSPSSSASCSTLP
ncbi:hypothetical protein ACFQY5_29590 [Paeniroseomonas aquatica]|uniref:hypothetical protein n=1 Tax=Paeniroseomonas aquatica TaxID=373043 RepID=UPI00361AB9E9